MRHELNIWVAGGDLRQVHLARLLSLDGHTVHTYALSPPSGSDPEVIPEQTLAQIHLADCVLLPLPVSKCHELLHAPLDSGIYPLPLLLDRLTPGQFLCGGRVSPSIRSLAAGRGLELRDYFSREELAIANAVPTAEGAVQLAMERLPITIHGAHVLVLGFGRVGRVTAQRFQALGAKTSVAARRQEQLAWARAEGLDAQRLDGIEDYLCGYDLIINTIPAPVFGLSQLENARPDCLILDLASAPGGVDLEAAQRLGRTVLPALSLPGKVAPATAGAAIRDTVYHMLEEAGF